MGERGHLAYFDHQVVGDDFMVVFKEAAFGRA
jgi:hypothetical protein